ITTTVVIQGERTRRSSVLRRPFALRRRRAIRQLMLDSGLRDGVSFGAVRSGGASLQVVAPLRFRHLQARAFLSDWSLMAARQWTPVVVSEENRPVRQLHLTRAVLRLVIGAGLVRVAMLSVLAVKSLFPGAQSSEARPLANHNAALTGELSTLTPRFAILQESMGA